MDGSGLIFYENSKLDLVVILSSFYPKGLSQRGVVFLLSYIVSQPKVELMYLEHFRRSSLCNTFEIQ